MRWQSLIAVPVVLGAGFVAGASSPATVAATETTAPVAVTAADGTAGVGVLPAEPAAPRALRGADARPATPAEPAADLPPEVTVAPGQPSPVMAGEGPLAIPELVLYAYRAAEMQLAVDEPECALPWHLLAAIGRISSQHADSRRTDVVGTLATPRVAPGTGRLGPMQLPPAVWAQFAGDGNADGAADPQNVFDSTLAAGRWLCSDGARLAEPEARARAAALFDPSPGFVSNVQAWSAAYEKGAAVAPTVVVPPATPLVPSEPRAVDVADAVSAGDQPAAPAPAPEPPSEALPPSSPPEPVPLPQLPAVPCLVPALCPAPATP